MDEITSALLSQIRDIEQRDERQIMQELAGETIDEYYYVTKVRDPKTKRMVDKMKLSWIGTKETARSYGNLVVDPQPVISDIEGEDAVRIVVRVTDLKRNFSVFGGCHQSKKQKINVTGEGGEIIGERYEPDPFYFQKGLSKAQRNAFGLCIPSSYVANMLNRFLRSGGRPAVAGPAPKRAISKAQVKPREEWEKFKESDIPDYPNLEKKFWELTHKQPADMYKELGVGGRSDIADTPAWQSFLTLMETYAPKELPPETNN
ncbi:MAG: hypothetical protein PHI12_08280 [Dehalococcoidales bacterium]|nr:hypothetical protein [Dehalococcoidales bacterium]